MWNSSSFSEEREVNKIKDLFELDDSSSIDWGFIYDIDMKCYVCIGLYDTCLDRYYDCSSIIPSCVVLKIPNNKNLKDLVHKILNTAGYLSTILKYFYPHYSLDYVAVFDWDKFKEDQ